MEQFLIFLTAHSSLALFGVSLGEQLGIPIPATPILLTAGSFAAMGRINPFTAGLAALIGSLLGDGTWYFLGRTRGPRVLQFLCKFSKEKGSCVDRAGGLLLRFGLSKTLVASKFVPGLSSMVRTLAGMSHVSLVKFSFYDGLASVLQIAVLAGAGYIFSDQLEKAIRLVTRLGGGLVLVGIGALLVYGVFELRRCHCDDEEEDEEKVKLEAQ